MHGLDLAVYPQFLPAIKVRMSVSLCDVPYIDPQFEIEPPDSFIKEKASRISSGHMIEVSRPAL